MHHIPRFFSPSNRNKRMNQKKKQTRPRLERRNAIKNIEYDASSSSSFDSSLSPSSSSSLHTRSLDLYDRTSFRVQGVEGDFDKICRSLGLTPEDFSIPPAIWEARKGRSSSDLLPKSKLYELDSLDSSKREDEIETKSIEATVDELSERVVDSLSIGNRTSIEATVDELSERVVDSLSIGNRTSIEATVDELSEREVDILSIGDRTELTRLEPAETSGCCIASSVGGCGGGVGARGGIKGVRPPLLKPPPSMRLPVIDNGCSTWDIVRDFAPDDEKDSLSIVHERYVSDENEQDNFEEAEHPREQEEAQVVEGQEETFGVAHVENGALSESCFYTSNDDDTSSSTTEPPSIISPNVRYRPIITNWQKGDLLGRGSFGSVYEGIAEDGFFFALKEVSLLDQGAQGRQSVYQLEQEIALLSKFEHENIVQYLGTDKDDSNLYIFLELVTKGSLQSLYQRYILWDQQVSAYTRQILHGLKYLHDQNVVHRDIKCANILVDASGSVKLADFGLAKATTLNDVKSCKGTAFWMAPEVVNGKGQGYGIPADIWSLGCTVLEMLTRKIPYSEFGPMPALYKIGNGVPPSVPEDLSRDARDFILQCIQVNPNHRPTAAKLLSHPFVRRLVSTSSGPTSPYHPGGRS